jgi:Phosphoglucomutase/phosphomannomutase, alpha/beta/alpha domain III
VGRHPRRATRTKVSRPVNRSKTSIPNGRGWLPDQKVCGIAGEQIGEDTGLAQIRAWLADGDIPCPSSKPGAITSQDLRGDYVRHLRSLVPLDEIRPLKVVADAGNGMAWSPRASWPATPARPSCTTSSPVPPRSRSSASTAAGRSAPVSATPTCSRVGHSYMKALMAEHDAAFGGEHSGHYYFRDFWRADTGLLTAMHVLVRR